MDLSILKNLLGDQEDISHIWWFLEATGSVLRGHFWWYFRTIRSAGDQTRAGSHESQVPQ